MTANNKGFCRI